MITFPAFIHETNGIILVSDGQLQATFSTVDLFKEAMPDYSLPEGLIGISYEVRSGTLMHRRHKVGGAVDFHDGEIDPDIEEIISQIDHIAAVFAQQQHPLHGYSDLVQLKQRAAIMVDTAAEGERLGLITAGSGQAMVYQEKKEEAERLQALIDGGTQLADIDHADFPFLSGEIGITGEDLVAVGDAIITQSTNWKLVSAAIEKVRLQTKSQIEAAQNVETVRTIFDGVDWPTRTSVLSQ